MIYLKILRLPHQILCVIPLFFGILDSGIEFPVYYFLGYLFSSMAGFAINEYIDSFDTDKFNHRAATGLNKNVVFGILTSLVLLALLAYWTASTLLLGIITITLMLTYSLPPIRLKKIPVLDIVVQTLAWAVIPYFVPFYISWQSPNLLPVIYMIMFLIGAVALAPIADISADRQGKIFNSTVVLGYKKSLTLGFFILAFALLIGPQLDLWYKIMVPPGMLALGVYGYARGNYDRPEKLEKILQLGKNWGTLSGYFLAAILFILILWQNGWHI